MRCYKLLARSTQEENCFLLGYQRLQGFSGYVLKLIYIRSLFIYLFLKIKITFANVYILGVCVCWEAHVIGAFVHVEVRGQREGVNCLPLLCES